MSNRVPSPSDGIFHTYCILCYARCPTIAHVKNGVLVKIEADLNHPTNSSACSKGTLAAPELVYAKDRIKYPMKRTRPKGDPDPGWVRISWEEALDTAAQKLLDIKKNHGSEAVFFYRPSRAGSGSRDYDDWVYRLSSSFGTPNTASTTHICNWHKDSGSKYTWGILHRSAGQYPASPTPDFSHTSCVLLWGVNPAATNVNYAKYITEARSKGAKLIVIDPRRTPLAAKADVWVPVRPGTDAALALSMIQVMIEEKLYDADFIRDWTNGPFLVRRDNGNLLLEKDIVEGGSDNQYVVWDDHSNSPSIYNPNSQSYTLSDTNPAISGEYRISSQSGEISCATAFQILTEISQDYVPEKMEKTTWAPADKVRNAARLFSTIKPACYFTYNGLEQHTNAMITNRAVCLVYALTGNFDTPGGNFIQAPLDFQKIDLRSDLSREVVQKRLGYGKRPLGPASAPGNAQAYEIYEAILTGKPYQLRGFVSIGGSLIMSNGDTLRGREALKNLEFFLAIDLFVNPTHLHADIILPASTIWEGWGLGDWQKADFAHIQLRRPVIKPLHESRPDIEILFDLAKRLGFGDKFWNGDFIAGYDHQLAPLGLSIEKLVESDMGISIPLEKKYRSFAEKDPRTGMSKGFDTPSKKIEIYSIALAKNGHEAFPRYREPAMSPVSKPDLAKSFPLVLTNNKILPYNHGAYRSIPVLRKQAPEPYVEIHPDTALEYGIKQGEWVCLETPKAGITVKAKLTPDIMPGVVSTQTGWWQECKELGLPGYDPFSPEGANFNSIIPNDDIDPITGSVPARSYLCRVKSIESQKAPAPIAHNPAHLGK